MIDFITDTAVLFIVGGVFGAITALIMKFKRITK